MKNDTFFAILTIVTLVLLSSAYLNTTYYCYQYDMQKVYSDLGYKQDDNGTYYTSIHSKCDTKLNWLYNIITTHDNGEN